MPGPYQIVEQHLTHRIGVQMAVPQADALERPAVVADAVGVDPVDVKRGDAGILERRRDRRRPDLPHLIHQHRWPPAAQRAPERATVGPAPRRTRRYSSKNPGDAGFRYGHGRIAIAVDVGRERCYTPNCRR